MLKSMDSQIVGHDLVTESNNNNIVCLQLHQEGTTFLK